MEDLPNKILLRIANTPPVGFRPLLGHVDKRFGRLVGRDKIHIRYFVLSVELVKRARENGCPWGFDTCAWAAGGGHLKVLKWARENGYPEN